MLTWPTADQLPANFEALGMASCEHMLQFVDPFDVGPISRNSHSVSPISENQISRNALASGCEHLRRLSWKTSTPKTNRRSQNVIVEIAMARWNCLVASKALRLGALRRLSQDVIYKVTATLFAVIRNDTIQQLLSQLRTAWLTTRQLPACIRHLFRGNRLSSLECGVLEAL